MPSRWPISATGMAGLSHLSAQATRFGHRIGLRLVEELSGCLPEGLSRGLDGRLAREIESRRFLQSAVVRRFTPRSEACGGYRAPWGDGLTLSAGGSA